MILAQFLVNAKKNTYAREGEGGEQKLDDGARELVYSEEEWGYRDRYYGFNPFVGQELVCEGDRIVWAMNYWGQITTHEIMADKVYAFLRLALQNVTEETPFRGPDRFESNPWRYTNFCQGTLERFNGQECIGCQGEIVYRGWYHGGTVREK